MKQATLLLLSVLFVGLTWASQETIPELHNFTSDGCSMSADQNLLTGKNWLRCCVNHDVYYWMGGSKEDRTKADTDFKACMTKESDALNAWAYYKAVNEFGSPRYKTSYRWGYGRTKDTNYRNLTAEEIQIRADLLQFINQLTDLSNFSYWDISVSEFSETSLKE